jgi:hypothetical protein
MATHETPADHFTPQPGSDRAIGVVVGGVLLTVSAYLWWSGNTFSPYPAAAGLALLVLGLVAPGSLHRLNLLWARFGVLLGRIVSPLVLGVVYLTTMIPIGLILRWSGKDLLSLKGDDDLATYWVAREPRGPAPESLREQF